MPGGNFLSDKCQEDKCLEAIFDRTNARRTNAWRLFFGRTNARRTNAWRHFLVGQMPGGQMPGVNFWSDKCQEDKCLKSILGRTNAGGGDVIVNECENQGMRCRPTSQLSPWLTICPAPLPGIPTWPLWGRGRALWPGSHPPGCSRSATCIAGGVRQYIS